jgi:hypothetical protein
LLIKGRGAAERWGDGRLREVAMAEAISTKIGELRAADVDKWQTRMEGGWLELSWVVGLTRKWRRSGVCLVALSRSGEGKRERMGA